MFLFWLRLSSGFGRRVHRSGGLRVSVEGVTSADLLVVLSVCVCWYGAS